jgi:hypothetical protein
MLNVDPNLPMFDVASLDSLVRAGRADRRFVMVLLLAAALWSMVLAAVSVYGVTASWLEGRGRELAIRLALGAEPAGLVRRVMRSSLAKAAAGAAAGLLLSGVRRTSRAEPVVRCGAAESREPRRRGRRDAGSRGSGGLSAGPTSGARGSDARAESRVNKGLDHTRA